MDDHQPDHHAPVTDGRAFATWPFRSPSWVRGWRRFKAQ